MRRKNPMPTTGATILLNGSRRHNAKKALKASPFSRIIAKLNGVAISNRRHNRKRNGVAISNRRRNGVAIKNRRRNATILLNRKRNGVAISNGRKRNATILLNRRKYNRKHNRRRNGVAISNGRKRNGRKRNASRLLNRRRNGAEASGTIFAPVAKLVSKIPVVGKFAAPYIGPIMFGTVGLAVVHYGLKFGFKYLPANVKSVVSPVAYTAGGIVLGLAVAALPVGNKKTKLGLGVAMVTVGAAVDLFRMFNGTSKTLAGELDGELDGDFDGDDLGDGGLWQLGADDFGADDFGADPEATALNAEYGDAEMGDAYYSGPDLDAEEGATALAGPRQWRRRFPVKRRHVRPTGGCSRHAKEHGGRWGWLCKLVGFKKFARLAALPADQRVAVIAKIRQYAISLAAGQNASGQIAAGLPNVSSLPSATAGYSEYGALLYAGG